MTKTRFDRLVPMSSMAALAAVLATASAPAFANMEALLEKLHSKGVLSDEEYKEMRQEAREATRANREFKADTAAAQEAAKKNLVAKEGFKFTDGKNWEIGLTGRINLDYRFKRIAGADPLRAAVPSARIEIVSGGPHYFFLQQPELVTEEILATAARAGW